MRQCQRIDWSVAAEVASVGSSRLSRAGRRRGTPWFGFRWKGPALAPASRSFLFFTDAGFLSPPLSVFGATTAVDGSIFNLVANKKPFQKND